MMIKEKIKKSYFRCLGKSMFLHVTYNIFPIDIFSVAFSRFRCSNTSLNP